MFDRFILQMCLNKQFLETMPPVVEKKSKQSFSRFLAKSIPNMERGLFPLTYHAECRKISDEKENSYALFRISFAETNQAHVRLPQFAKPIKLLPYSSFIVSVAFTHDHFKVRIRKSLLNAMKFTKFKQNYKLILLSVNRSEINIKVIRYCFSFYDFNLKQQQKNIIAWSN